MADEDYTKLPRSRQEAIACGSQFFFTGVPCKKGHIGKRYTKGGDCQPCAVERATDWQKTNPGRHAISVKKWEEKNPGVRDMIEARYRANHREELNAKAAERRAADPETFRSRNRDYYAANRDEIIDRRVDYGKDNPDKVNAIAKAKLDREAEAEGYYTEEDVLRILISQDYLCAGCGKDIRTRYTADHIIPVPRGGSNWPSNIQCLCRSCNSSKGTMTMDEWMARRVADEDRRAGGSPKEWANDGRRNKSFPSDAELPEGWQWGRVSRRKAA